MREIKLVEGQNFNPEHRSLGIIEFTQNVLRECKSKRKHGLTGTITIDEVKLYEHILFHNEADENFIICYTVLHQCDHMWGAGYTLLKQVPKPVIAKKLSDGYCCSD